MMCDLRTKFNCLHWIIHSLSIWMTSFLFLHYLNWCTWCNKLKWNKDTFVSFQYIQYISSESARIKNRPINCFVWIMYSVLWMSLASHISFWHFFSNTYFYNIFFLKESRYCNKLLNYRYSKIHILIVN